MIILTKHVNDTVINTIGTVVYYFATWAMTLVLARFSSYTDVGTFSIAVTLTNIFVSVSNYGMRGYQVADIKGKHSTEHYLISRIFTSIVGFVACVIMVINQKRTINTVIVVVLFMLFRTIEAYVDVIYGILQQKGHLRLVGISQFLRGITVIITFLVVHVAFKSLTISVSSIFIVSLIVLFVYDFQKMQFVGIKPIHWSKESIIGAVVLLRNSFLSLMLSITNPIYISVPRIEFERNYSTELFGIFSALWAPTVIISLVTNTVMLAAIPVFANYKIKGEKNKLVKALILFLLTISVVGFFGYIFSLAFGRMGLRFLYGAKTDLYWGVFPSLMIVSAMSSVISVYYTFLIATEGLVPIFISSLIPLLLIFMVARPLIISYGMNGIALSMIISLSAQVLLLSIMVAFALKNVRRPENYSFGTGN